METPVLRLKLDDSSGFGTKIYGAVIIAGGIWLFTSFPELGVFMILFGVLPFLQHKCLEIDLYQGTYTIGVNMLGFTIGDTEPYPGIKCIFIKRNRTTNFDSHRSWRRIVHTSFDCYLWLEDDTKILLSGDSKKEQAIKRVQPLAEELKTEILDLTAPLSQV